MHDDHDDEEDTTIYLVVANDEEQYSIWPADQTMPAGWRHAGPAGRKPECLAYIRDAWTDLRPLSLRQRIGDTSAPNAAAPNG